MKNNLIKISLLSSLVTSLAFSYDAIVLEDSNIREKPSLTAKVINIKFKNEYLDIEKLVFTKTDGTWYKTKNGYISSELISFDNTKNKNHFTSISSLKNSKYYVDVRTLNKKPIIFIDKKTGYAYSKIILPFKNKEDITKVNFPNKFLLNNNKTEEKKIEKKENKYFLGLSLGLSHISTEYNKVNGVFSSVKSSDTNGFNFGWEAGYYINKNSFSTVSYNQMNLNDVAFYNYLVSYNRILKNIPYNTYIGILAGISYSKVTQSPVANLVAKDTRTKANAIGLQIGASYNIKKDLNIFTQYQYIKAKHTTNIISQTAKANIQRSDLSNLMFGIRWDFETK